VVERHNATLKTILRRIRSVSTVAYLIGQEIAFLGGILL